MQISFRTVFGSTECEVGAEGSTEAGFVAWVLRVLPNGRLEPIFDKRGCLLMTRGSSAETVIAQIRARAITTFGGECVQVAQGERSRAETLPAPNHSELAALEHVAKQKRTC